MVLTPGFLTKVRSIRVERVPAHDFGAVDLSKAPVGVGHTTEGSFESALQKFESVDAPHFLVGADRKGKVRICQLVALGRTAGALEHRKGTVETNSWARAQIELAGFSKKSPWLPNQDVLDAFTQLVAALRGTAGIPLHRPFPDAMIPAGIIWATTKNPRRNSGHWGRRSQAGGITSRCPATHTGTWVLSGGHPCSRTRSRWSSRHRRRVPDAALVVLAMGRVAAG